MDDSFEELEKVFKEKIEQVKNARYEELKAICEQENLDYEDIPEEELKELLINYFEEEIGE